MGALRSECVAEVFAEEYEDDAAAKIQRFVGLFIERLSKYAGRARPDDRCECKNRACVLQFQRECADQKYAAETSASNVISAGEAFAFVNRYAGRAVGDQRFRRRQTLPLKYENKENTEESRSSMPRYREGSNAAQTAKHDRYSEHDV